jgi:hypothetical protein
MVLTKEGGIKKEDVFFLLVLSIFGPLLIIFHQIDNLFSKNDE